jgi:hypothetical protein
MDNYARGKRGKAAPWQIFFWQSAKNLSNLEKEEDYFFSVGYLAFTQAFQPPLRAKTFKNPISISSCATRALVASSGQAQ